MGAHNVAGVIDFVALSTWVAALSRTGISRVPLLCASFIFHLPTHYFGLAYFLWLLTITNRQAAIEMRAAVKLFQTKHYKMCVLNRFMSESLFRWHFTPKSIIYFF